MNMLTKDTALTEKGAVVNGRGDTPNMHDILTGSQPDGKARDKLASLPSVLRAVARLSHWGYRP